MWPFRKHTIKETKHYPYGGRIEASNFSVWEGMSIIEKFAMVGLPSLMVFMSYTMLDTTGLIWWMKLGISIGSVLLIMTILFLVVTWLMKDSY